MSGGGQMTERAKDGMGGEHHNSSAAVRKLTTPALHKTQPPESWRRPQDHLDTLLTSPWYRSLAIIIDEVVDASHTYFRGLGARCPTLPVTTGAVSSPMGLGCDSTPVEVRLGGQHVYLADSMQFHLELAARLYTGDVYYVMPSFRAEPCDARHLNEFFHIEAELHGGLEETLAVAEGLVRALAEQLLERCEAPVVSLAGSSAHLRDLVARRQSFPRLRHDELLKELRAGEGLVEEQIPGEFIITAAGERRLIEVHGDFIWLTHLPWRLCPFYQAPEPGTSASLTADLLAGIGEILGSGQRITTRDSLHDSLVAHQVDPEKYAWYLRMKSLAPLPTGGFGLGLERFLMWVTRTTDIRDCTLLLREHGRTLAP